MAAIKLLPEAKEQILIVNWIHQMTDLPVIYIKNEEKRSYGSASIVKKMGLHKGCADLFIPRANESFHGLFLEVKSEKGKISPDQHKFEEQMLREQYLVVFVFGHVSAIHTLRTFYSLQSDASIDDIDIP
jgi:SPX domain protein involved in polyphosphate accumulation